MSSWIWALPGDDMHKMREKILRFGVTALLLLCLTPLAGCGQQRQLKENRQAFERAVKEGNYPVAADVYLEASVRENFDPKPFAEVLRLKSENVVAEYKQGRMEYDKADLMLQALAFNEDLNELLKEDFAAARASIKPPESMDESLKQAKLYAEAGDYRSSLECYDKILANYPEDAEARSQRAETLGEYVTAADKQSEELEKQGYPRTAVKLVERALAYDADNQVLKDRKAELEKDIKEKTEKIKSEIPVYELGLLLKDGDLKAAEAYIDEVKSKLKEKDVERLQLMLDEEIDRYIKALIDRAAAEAEEDYKGRWTSSPYARAVGTLQEGLSLYPDNAALAEAVKGYEEKTPLNVSGRLVQNRGSIQENASGANAAGYNYDNEGFDKAVLTKPDMSFTYKTNGYESTRLIISPKTADAAVYQNMVMTITVGGETVYSGEPFSADLDTLDLSFDLKADTEVTVTLRQSGFASFFESVLGRNNVFFEMYLLP